MEPEDYIEEEEIDNEVVVDCYYCGVELLKINATDIDDHLWCGWCDPDEELRDQAMWDAADDYYKRKIESED